MSSKMNKLLAMVLCIVMALGSVAAVAEDTDPAEKQEIVSSDAVPEETADDGQKDDAAVEPASPAPADAAAAAYVETLGNMESDALLAKLNELLQGTGIVLTAEQTAGLKEGDFLTALRSLVNSLLPEGSPVGDAEFSALGSAKDEAGFKAALIAAVTADAPAPSEKPDAEKPGEEKPDAEKPGEEKPGEEDPAEPEEGETAPAEKSVADVLFELRNDRAAFEAELGTLMPGAAVTEDDYTAFAAAPDMETFSIIFGSVLGRQLTEGTETVLLMAMTPEAFAEKYFVLALNSDVILYDRLMKATSAGELNEIIKAYGDSEKYRVFLESLDEEKLTELVAHLNEVIITKPYEPHTVVFTQAGPFLPPVFVGNFFMTQNYAEGDETPSDNGLELRKSVSDNGDGTYTVTLESWTTGKVTITEIVEPTDFCLVVDQSHSMNEMMNGKTKAATLQDALKKFVGDVGSRNTNGVTHHIAIEGFAENQQHNNLCTHTGWVEADAAGITKLNDEIDKMQFDEESTNTNITHGLDEAIKLMKKPAPGASKRNQVVIVFTDGYPSTTEHPDDHTGASQDFADDIALSAVFSAATLKGDGVTIYTVAMFEGANPSELYGKENQEDHCECDGSTNYPYSKWTYFNDRAAGYNPGANRFLNYLSSNAPEADNPGISKAGICYGPNNLYYGINITMNQPVNTSAGYYLTPDDQESLDNAFHSIVQHTSSPTMKLGKDTVLRDTVTPYFDMPENTSDIQVFTAKAKADGSFEKPVKNKNLIPQMHGSTVEVSGFNYDENFVTDKEKTPDSKDYGRKLIVKFKVTPKPEFLGGNGVPTNITSESGILKDKNSSEFVENFPEPEPVDVPMSCQIGEAKAEIDFGEPAPLNDLAGQVMKNEKGKYFVAKDDGTECKLNGKNNEFVTVTYNVYSEGENPEIIGTYTVKPGETEGKWDPKLTDPSDLSIGEHRYPVSVTLTPDKPDKQGEKKSVTSAPEEGKEKDQDRLLVTVKPGYFQLKKIVDGSMGDFGQSFLFNITKPTDDPNDGDTIEYLKKIDDTGIEVLTVLDEENGISLHHNESCKVGTVKSGDKITVTEHKLDYAMSAKVVIMTDKGENTEEFTKENGGITVNDNEKTGTFTFVIPEGMKSINVTVTNAREGHPDTGVVLDSLPYILILVIVAAAVTVVVVRKNRRRNDD